MAVDIAFLSLEGLCPFARILAKTRFSPGATSARADPWPYSNYPHSIYPAMGWVQVLTIDNI
jgi:hypothetical protein